MIVVLFTAVLSALCFWFYAIVVRAGDLLVASLLAFTGWMAVLVTFTELLSCLS